MRKWQSKTDHVLGKHDNKSAYTHTLAHSQITREREEVMKKTKMKKNS